MSTDSVANLHDVKAAIEAAAKDAGRDDEPTLVAVSKTYPAEAIRPVLEAGHRCFGENRVQESQGKWPELKAAFPDTELHLIGPLQTNKAREAVRLFDVIETVDRPKLARALAKAMAQEGRTPRLFVQINTGLEEQKAGIAPEDADAFLKTCRDEHGLMIEGLMCIPPFHENPAPHFALLEKIAKRNGLARLSMGMSADYETAIGFGATHVRVGTAIFGPRG